MNKTLILILVLPLFGCIGNVEDVHPKVEFQIQQSGSKASFRGIAVKSDQIAWVTGTGGTVLKTSNGGQNWQKVKVPDSDSLDFRDIELLGDKTILLMSAGSGVASRIYKSDDFGASWLLVYSNPFEKGFYNGFDFWDKNNGMLIGDAIDGKLFLMKTTDGGDNWNRIGEETLPDLMEGEYGFAASGTGITTFGNQKIWVATGGSAARVFYSLDAGNTWNVSNTPMISGKPSTGSFSIVFKDESTGIAVGGDYAADSIATGNVILTKDGGQSWFGIKHPETMPFKSCVLYLGDSICMAIGTSGVSVSYDGGQSWSSINKTPFHTMDFHKPSGTGWMAGGDGQITKFKISNVEK